MGSLSVNLDSISIGSRKLVSSEICSLHRERVDKNLRKIFNAHSNSQKTPSSIQIKLNPNHPVLLMEGKEIPLEKSPELKKIERIVHYYQNTGHFPQKELSLKDQEQVKAETFKSIKAIHNASIPETNGHLLAGMRLADDTLSLTRNILFAIPNIGQKDPIVNHLGYYGGVFWAFFAARELDDGLIEHKRSKMIGDEEGVRRSQLRVGSGGIISTASLTYLMGKFANTYISEPVSSGFLGASNALFGVGSLLAMGASFLGALRCQRFKERLNEYLDNPELPEDVRMKSALTFLKECISVNAEEKENLRLKIEEEHPTWPAEKKLQLLNQKIRDLTEVKIKYMKRRTSAKSLQLILNQADNILKLLGSNETRVEGITKATALINAIEKENRTKKTLYMLGFVAALISFVAMAIMTFGSLSSLPFIFYGVSGSIYLLITIYTAAGTFLKKAPKNKETEINSLPSPV